jgi:trimethylamine--corrinoid protein Co-methyltransferase
LMHPGTMANCRNVWMPAVSDWSSYDAWKKNGGIDILQKAHQRFKQRLESSFGKVLSPEIDQDISRYLEKK